MRTVVVRGHPGDIPGFRIEICILGYTGCCVRVAVGNIAHSSLLFLLFVFPFFSVVIIISYFASTRVADSPEWYSYMLASS